MAEMAENILHRALTEGDSPLEGKVGGVDLPVTFLMEDPAPGGVLLRPAADPLQADGREQPRPGGRVVVRDVSLPLSLPVPPVALRLLLRLNYRTLGVIRFLMEWKYYKMTHWTKM